MCADDDDATPESEPEPAAGAERATASLQWPSLEFSLGSLRREIPGRTSRNHTDGRGM